ncbi:ribosomal protein S6 kinase-related protein-like isoform X2 [Rhipicephalus microplus]|uniref:ribosomal protein S6 kinase-related protein-like isoform X2 n=1 Tax=Rhipicephalus microplus TaxID=6941 RepID=UPI003F6AB9D4
MGNSQPKPSSEEYHQPCRRWSSAQSQLSWGSSQSVQSVASAQRSWSRASTSLGRRRQLRWQPHLPSLGSAVPTGVPAASADPLAKTPWPVTLAEALFLPEFPVRSKLHEANFQKVKQLSGSKFGSVYLVREAATGKCYAMKVLSKAQVVREEAIQQCKDEVTIQAVLGRHPFVVPCTHHWQTLTEYVPHGELRLAWRALGGFSEDLVRVLIAELALVLDFLHCAGVIYRDLKMENVLLDEDGHIQLIDFGLARWLSYCARAQTVCGTMQFMAPEVLAAQPYSHAADWWSLGIMMYALLVGRYPVEGTGDHVQMKQLVANANYDLPEGFSDNARKLCRKLLCKLPHKRLQSLHQLKWEPFFRELNFDDVLHKKISPKTLLQVQLEKSGRSTPGIGVLAESQDSTKVAFAGFSCLVKS